MTVKILDYSFARSACPVTLRMRRSYSPSYCLLCSTPVMAFCVASHTTPRHAKLQNFWLLAVTVSITAWGLTRDKQHLDLSCIKHQVSNNGQSHQRESRVGLAATCNFRPPKFPLRQVTWALV